VCCWVVSTSSCTRTDTQSLWMNTDETKKLVSDEFIVVRSCERAEVERVLWLLCVRRVAKAYFQNTSNKNHSLSSHSLKETLRSHKGKKLVNQRARWHDSSEGESMLIPRSCEVMSTDFFS
jgi:hypothetical protein